MAYNYTLTKSKYIRGLQCVKALYLDVFKPKLAYYPPKTLAKFRQGRIFESTFKNTFPNGIDISNRLRHHINRYPILTAELIKRPAETVIFEAGFLYNNVLVLADVVHKYENNTLDIYEIKNSTAINDTLRNDVNIQYYVIQQALHSIQFEDLFYKAPTIKHFYLLYNDGSDGFIKEDLLEQAQTACDDIKQNIARFKLILKESEPTVAMSDHCDIPYECPYKHYCKRL